MTYKIQDREAGNVIESGLTLDQAELMVMGYYQEDKASGTFEENFYEIKKENEFCDEAEERETSAEIMEAIVKIAGQYGNCERIWMEPTDAEKLAIWEIVTKNGLHDGLDFWWGCQDAEWWK